MKITMKYLFLVKKLITLLLYYWSQIPETCSLKNVRISMPGAVQRGEKVRLQCKYDLEDEILYTLKWFKQEQEFFRFTPKEIPSTKFFTMKAFPELEIIPEESYRDQVTIKNVTLGIAGHFACEVTTDIPSFHAMTGHGELLVAVLPAQYQELPLIRGNKPKVTDGELLNVECVSSRTIPAANLTWSLNNKPIHGRPNITVTKRVVGDDLEETTSVLSLRITEKHFKENNSLKVRCTASIYSLYQKMSEINILLQRIPVSKTFFSPEKGSSQFFTPPPSKVKLSQSNILVDRANREYNIHANEPENLENTNESAITRGSIHVLLVAIMARLSS